MRKLWLLVSSALICTSCSSYYANHARHNNDRVNAKLSQNRFAHHPKSPARFAKAQTHGVQVDPKVQGYDNDFDNTVVDVDPKSTRFEKWSASAHNNKCYMAKPAGGVEQHYFFDFNKSLVVSKDNMSVQKQAKYLIQHPSMIARIEGNTDDRGSREYNVALGARRANAIIAALKQQGVSSQQLTSVSYGAEKPVLLGDTEKDYHCNRRVDVIYEVR